MPPLYIWAAVLVAPNLGFPVFTVFLSNWSECKATTRMGKLDAQLALYSHTSSL